MRPCAGSSTPSRRSSTSFSDGSGTGKLAAPMIEGRKVNIQKEIRSVLQVQASAILAARRHIGPAFDKAVREIYRCKGKIVVTGIGKSGLIAQKIASTLSSTG